MVLRKSNKTKTPAAAASNTKNTNKVETDKVETTDATTDATTDVAVEKVVKETATTVSAEASGANALAVVAPTGPAPSLLSLQNFYPGEEMGGDNKRIVPASGKIKIAKDNTILGEFIDVQLISSSERWMVAPVAPQNDKEAKKFCRPSYDGKTIPNRDGEEPQLIKDYVESCGDKYEEFTVKKYLDLFVILVHSGDPDMQDLVATLPMVQVSVSPTAVGSYRTFERQTNLTMARGMMTPEKQNCFRITAKAESSDTSEWTIMTFAPTPLEDLADYTPVDMGSPA